MKYIILILSFSIIFYNCKKEKEMIPTTPVQICESPILETSPADTCFDLPQDALGNVVTNYHQDYFFSSRFSKNEPDEFIFAHAEINNEFKVYKSNLCNEYYEAGFDMSTLDNTKLFDFNKNDELLVSSGFKIWRVDFDGNNLLKLSDDDSDYYGAQWCLNDTVILTHAAGFNSPYYPGRTLLLNKLGEVIHVFPEGEGYGKVNNEGDKIATFVGDASFREIGYIDLNTKEFNAIKEIDVMYNFTGILGWLDDEHILYGGSVNRNQKFFYININTAESVLFYEKDCENIALGDFTISPFNQEEILMTRTEHRYVANHPDSLYYFQNIVKYNINTGEDKILDFNF